MPLKSADLLSSLQGRGLEVSPGMVPVAWGWATVDRERAALDFAPLCFRAAPDEEALGASTSRTTLSDSTVLVLLEPSTEGRLAAALARHGEGPVAVWLADPVPDSASASPSRPTAIGGRARLLRPEHPWGPFVLYHQPVISNEPTVRPAIDADAEAIAALFTDEGYPAGPSDIRERLSRFSSPFSTVRVAEIGGELVGFVAVHAMPRFEHGDRIARVLALVVDAGVRERGIGHLLMSAAEGIARETGCAFIEVTAGRHRPDAQHLYESLGYDAGIATYLRKRL